MQNVQNIFRYGQTGLALDGFRDSEISKQSANTLRNFYISEMGTLRVAKKYEKKVIANSGEILTFRDTKYKYFLILTATHIKSIHKETLATIAEFAHGQSITKDSNINIFNDFIFIQGETSSTVLGIDKDGRLGSTNFFDTIELPFRDKQDVVIDYYKVFEITIADKKELRPEIMATYSGDLELETKEGHVYLKNLDIKIDRMYKQFKSSLSKDDITDIKKGQTYLVFRNFKKEDSGAYYHFGNTKVEFTGLTDDPAYGSGYFTGATPNGASGKCIYGVLEDFLQDVVDIVEFQSRLVIASSDKVYFSTTLDYNNFVPDLDSSGAFFIKPSPIDGNQPVITKLTVGTGLYITCEKGIVVIGYGAHLTPASSMGSVRIAGNSPTTKLSALVEDDFYYIDTTGMLRCILLNVDAGVIQFTNNIAEKYSFVRKNITHLTKAVVNESNVLVATMNNNTEIKVYSKIEGNLFRNFSLDFDTSSPVWGYNENLISKDSFYDLTLKNMPIAELTLNMPQVTLKGRGDYLNDFEVMYSRMVLNILNENKAIEGVTIFGRDLNPKPLQNLSTTIGSYNLYDLQSTISIIHPKIQINTIESEDVIEIRGVNTLIGG